MFSQSRSIRPSVAGANGSRSIWIFVTVLALVAGSLFAALEGRRSAVREPSLGPALESGDLVGVGGNAGPPPLILPRYDAPPQMPLPVVVPPAVRAAEPRPQFQPPPVPQTVYVTQQPPPDPPPVRSAQPYNVGPPPPSERVTASRFLNPSSTVPKGTVIMAVLESALDSARPGMARAMISRDVRGFDGTGVLIPRGSRLTGEYKSDVGAGQKRALIQWQRLLRPDGVVINLDSPVADPLGRAGVEGKLNSHFWARFSGALLQSAVNIGNQAAINSLSQSNGIYGIPVIGGYPQAAGGGGVIPQLSSPVSLPTLTVKPGTSVSVFTARDLDFSSVDQ